MPLFIPSFSLVPIDYIEATANGSANKVISQFRFMRIFMFGGGGGGGGGMSRASITVSKYGGGGGGSGQYLDLLFPCAEFGTGEQLISYTIPNNSAGGVGGDPTAGTLSGYGGDGVVGGNTLLSIGTLSLTALGGAAGEGATVFNGLGGQANNSGGGGNSSSGQTSQQGGSGYAGSGGGGGGVNTDSTNARTGGNGGAGGFPLTTASNIATGGDGRSTTNGVAGAGGTNYTISLAQPYIRGGGGGGGGGATRGSGLNGGAGGQGALFGGGGGGGGASGNATTVGVGGAGGAGGKGGIKILFYR